ncbi:MAG: energy-coupling factor transporter ATPase [Anaerolineae bacterium]|nr:energy-coupling factor transporter ATPase [Anaerolineae bacterium]MCX8068245.1 energy-coupling factor transporter ATPase [Anaerolineae bacterium]MDW7991708.1 energy-coupling factor transporter ATPase [Anaerolineae bacterium]
MPPFIQTRGLEYAYPLDGRVIRALRGVDLTVERGEFVALIGPNGSGKSTLARHLNALLIPTAGEVWIDGMLTSDPRHLREIRRRVGMVFQNPDNQLVASTVEEEVAFGPENLGIPPEEIRRRVDEALEIVGMTGYRHHPPYMLSGGQKQRIAIAGALAARPDCLVLDEPTSMLDAHGRQQVMETLVRLNREVGLTIVLITQSMEEASLAHRVAVMDGGRIVLEGSPAEVFERAEALRGLGLGLPFAAEMAHRLRGMGIPLPPGLLTVEELARALCTSG